MNPLNIAIMDVDKHVADNNLMEVTSAFIKEPSTGNFNLNGLFSEQIFGEIASPERIYRKAYIDLHTNIIHPKLYGTLLSLNSLYLKIINSVEFAVFNKSTNDFELSAEDVSGADTGITFFLNHVKNIVPKESGAIRRDTKVKIILQNKNKMFITKVPVLPAGLRDYKDTDGRGEYSDINKLYMTLINTSRVLIDKTEDSKLFDPVIRALQKKVLEIYEYIWNIADGKKGFIQRKYGARGVALGTRNVIGAAPMSASGTNDPALLHSDEVLIPLYQAINMVKPLVIHHLKSIFFNNVFNNDTVQASLIDKETKTLAYHSVALDEKQKFSSSDKIADMITAFRDDVVKHMPVVVEADDNKEYYIGLVYRKDDTVLYFRSKSDLEAQLSTDGNDVVIDDNYITPLTYFEMFYIAAQTAMPFYTLTTRFPVVGTGSIYPAKVQIATTTKFISARLRTATDIATGGNGRSLPLPRFPITDSPSINAMVPHPLSLAPLGGDFDGDTVSNISVMSQQGIDECRDYLNSPKAVVGANGKVTIGLSTDLSKMVIYNLTI